MPLPLLIFLYPILSALSKIVFGTASAALIYYFLSNTVRPVLDSLTSELLNQVSDFSQISGSALSVITYFDFPHLISLIIATSTACFSIKLMSIAVRAFGINTG